MWCELRNREAFKSRDELVFETIETFVTSDHFDLSLCRCKECGQLYLHCYREICMDDYDDQWTWWVPVVEEEVPLIRANHSTGIKLLQLHRRITWPPSGTIQWEDLPDIALMGFYLDKSR